MSSDASRQPRFLKLFLVMVLPLLLPAQTTQHVSPNARGKDSHMQITSKDFQPQSEIPARFTCDGDNISPELSWKDAPASTKSFVLIVDDPDAPRAGGYTHWVMYGIPNSVMQLSENIAKTEKVPNLGDQGKNDGGHLGYTGPCPPSGTHRYYFHLYALDTALNLGPGATKADLERAMKGHVLAECELMGKYKRSGSKAA